MSLFRVTKSLVTFTSSLSALLAETFPLLKEYKGHTEEVRNLGNEIMTLCKSKAFNISTDDITSLNSFNELLIQTPDSSKSYLISQVENFYTDIIEPSKDELH